MINLSPDKLAVLKEVYRVLKVHMHCSLLIQVHDFVWKLYVWYENTCVCLGVQYVYMCVCVLCLMRTVCMKVSSDIIP